MFDGYKLPFENDVFDLAMCSHVIEHVEYPRMLIREICRVSKKQIFEVPIDFSLNVDNRVDYFMSYGHINIYTPQTFRFLLKSEGLKIEKFHNNLYDKAVDDYQNQNKSNLVKIKTFIKRITRKYMPFMMQIKPHTTTVRTSKLTSGLEIMKNKGCGGTPIIVGGIIPDDDHKVLKDSGVRAVYTPKDYSLNKIMEDFARIVDQDIANA